MSIKERVVEVPRIKHGRRQTVDTLISEEALLLAKYLRNERGDWVPRIPAFNMVCQETLTEKRRV